MPEHGKRLVRQYFEEIFNQNRLDLCHEIIAVDYVEHARAPFGREEPGRVAGPRSIRETVAWTRAQYPDITMRIDALIAEGDIVAARVHSTGTNTGKLNGMMPPTGKRFAADQSHWFRVADGKLAEHWATRDDLPAMLQLGIIQPPGPPRP